MASVIQMLRDEMHAAKESFDRMLAQRPSMTRAERLTEWERLLVELKPASERLARAEHHAEVLAKRKIKEIRDYGYGTAVRA